MRPGDETLPGSPDVGRYNAGGTFSVRRYLAFLLLAVVPGLGCVGSTRPTAATTAPRVVLEAPTRVPIRVVQNITLVQATINRTYSATLIVDTGAQSTVISPAVVKQLGMVINPDAPRRQVSVVGGQKVEMPFVKLAVLRVGAARMEDLEVGVLDVTPKSRGIHGLLGADFLHQFRLILDRGESVMQLEPLK